MKVKYGLRPVLADTGQERTKEQTFGGNLNLQQLILAAGRAPASCQNSVFVAYRGRRGDELHLPLALPITALKMGTHNVKRVTGTACRRDVSSVAFHKEGQKY